MIQHSVDTTSNPSHMAARYEIRRLTEREIPWIKSIVVHSHCFHSPIWPVLYPNGIAKRAYNAFDTTEYLVRHQVASGHSFGVFDLEYKYKSKEAERQGGKLFWNNLHAESTGEEWLKQMDFPLVTIALAYDGINPLDMEEVLPLIGSLPAFGTIYHHLEMLDPRSSESWKPTREREVLMRNATSTRHDYEGKGLMRLMADWLMRYAYEQGFRGIQIECIADQVTKVWTSPPKPFKPSVVSEFNTWDYTEEEEVDGNKTGNVVNPFDPCRQRMVKVWVDLRTEEK